MNPAALRAKFEEWFRLVGYQYGPEQKEQAYHFWQAGYHVGISAALTDDK